MCVCVCVCGCDADLLPTFLGQQASHMWRLGHLKIMTSCNEPNSETGSKGRERGRGVERGRGREADHQAWQPLCVPEAEATQKRLQHEANTGRAGWQAATARRSLSFARSLPLSLSLALWQAKVAGRQASLQLSAPKLAVPAAAAPKNRAWHNFLAIAHFGSHTAQAKQIKTHQRDDKKTAIASKQIKKILKKKETKN